MTIRPPVVDNQIMDSEAVIENRRISVIIPTYNHANYLKHAIDSVLDQTYPNIEIVIVDDGSTDNTDQVVAEYGDAVVCIKQNNQGLSAARNTGIRAATGDYIALLDADDTWLPSYLVTVAACLDSDPDLGAVHSGFYFVDEHGDRLPQLGMDTVPDDQMYDRLLDGEFFIPSSVLTRRACFSSVGLFDEQLRASEDWDMWLRVAHDYRFAGISEPLVNYRIHGKNMSADPEYMLQYQLLVVNKLFGSPGDCTETGLSECKKAYAAVYRYAAQGFFGRGDQIQGQHFLHLALETNPELAESVDLFYELGCADQPLGWRGDLKNLNFETNAAQLTVNLEKIFDEPELPIHLRSRRHTAFAHAFFALGLLAYGSDRYRKSRSYLWKALITDIRLGRRRQLWLTLAKTMIGHRPLQFFKYHLLPKRPRPI